MGGNSGVVYRNAGTSIVLHPSVTEATEFKTVAEIRGSDEDAEQILSAFVSARDSTRSLIAPSTSPTYVDGMAQVTFGVGGVTMDLFCDIVLGGLIALPCSYMRLAVRLNADPDNLMAADVTLYGGIATNVRPGTINPQLTFKQPALAGGGAEGVRFNVPPFARRVHAIVDPFAAVAGATLRFFRENTIIAETALPASPAQAQAIPGDCNAVAIVTGAAAITRARLMFELQT